MRTLLLLLLGCPSTVPVDLVPDTGFRPIETDTDTDVDADTDADTDSDTDTDGDTGETGAVSTGETGEPSDSAGPDTAIFAVTCDTGTNGIGVEDCDGACWPEAWIGDGVICDDGTLRPWGDPNFACAAFGFDGGDCAADTAAP